LRRKLNTLLFAELAVLALLVLLAVSLYSRETDDPVDTTQTSQTTNTVNNTMQIVPSQGVVDNPFEDINPGGTVDNSATIAPATKPNGPDTKPSEPINIPSTGSAESILPSSKPTESTSPSVSATRPSVPSTKPSETVSPSVPSTQPEPTTRPSEPAQESNPTMDYETYINLSAKEQKAYRETFESLAAFFEWYNAGKKEYEEQKPNVDIGNGTIDLEDIMGGGKQ